MCVSERACFVSCTINLSTSCLRFAPLPPPLHSHFSSIDDISVSRILLWAAWVAHAASSCWIRPVAQMLCDCHTRISIASRRCMHSIQHSTPLLVATQAGVSTHSVILTLSPNNKGKEGKGKERMCVCPKWKVWWLVVVVVVVHPNNKQTKQTKKDGA